jgi:mannose-6-phosphate isomerase
MPETPLYPLKFEPIYKEKVWGGRHLHHVLGRDLPGGDDTPIGESWELADLPTTSASGGGGNPEHSVVTHGPLAGQTLHDVIETYGPALMGDLPVSDTTGGFPLLLKFLDARQNLSVQVHPSPAYADDHDEAHLKSEAWYILDADPGAVIYKGIKEGVTPEQLRAALEQNTDDAVVPLMIEVPVKPGDCHYLPSGTCHALAAGVLVAEVQTPSDTTFRVYDWGRTNRELHVEQALECIDFGPPDVSQYELNTTLDVRTGQTTRLVVCEFFRMDRYAVRAGETDQLTHDQPTLWMVLSGEGRITCDTPAPGSPSGDTTVTPFGKGQTLLLPPNLPGATVSTETDCVWIEVTFPQAGPPRLA